ncbi:MAG: hypothetical protein OXE57_11185 [Alphaproteobacteria bacterium]|nr:hypothetical protein [Alphaproteobacteria bacterium]
MTTREDCVTLDAGDPLAYLREEFLVPAGTLRFDSDRLGPLTRGVRARLDGFLRVDWGTDFTNDGRHLAEAAAGKLAPLLGAQAGSLGFAATADDAIEALADAACASGRKRVLALPGEFAALPARLGTKGLTVTETEAPEAQLDRDALLLLRHLDPATGALRDMAALAAQAREAGALAAFDVSETAGALPAALEPSGVEAAVGRGCGFLGGGPGAPAWIHATGELGAALEAVPAPSALALAALDGALDMFAGIDIAAAGWKARTLTALFLGALGEDDPLPPARRGAHVVLERPDAEALAAALAADGVLAHTLPPDRISFALSPLLLRHVDAWDAAEAVRARQEG